jgi:methionyl-tRNA formyltransferase
VKSCVLFLQRNHRLNAEALAAVQSALEIKITAYNDEPGPSDQELKELKPDLILNFLCDKVHRGAVLTYPTINFHPAPPEYPGRGGASLALYDGKVEFGATAHSMIKKVDAGVIYDVETFAIKKNDGCDDVFRKAEDACLILLRRNLQRIKIGGKPPTPLKLQWSGKSMSRKDFDQWLILNPANKDEFLKKIRAASHPKFPGPYVIVHGLKFAFVPESK